MKETKQYTYKDGDDFVFMDMVLSLCSFIFISVQFNWLFLLYYGLLMSMIYSKLNVYNAENFWRNKVECEGCRRQKYVAQRRCRLQCSVLEWKCTSVLFISFLLSLCVCVCEREREREPTIFITLTSSGNLETMSYLLYKIWRILSVFLKLQVIGFDLPINVALKVIDADAPVGGDAKGCIYFSTTYLLFHFCLFTYFSLFISIVFVVNS
jgi:hypothetical protein